MACLVAFSPLSANAAKKQKKAKKAQTELWPDGTKMDAWFSNAQKVNVDIPWARNTSSPTMA